MTQFANRLNRWLRLHPIDNFLSGLTINACQIAVGGGLRNPRLQRLKIGRSRIHANHVEWLWQAISGHIRELTDLDRGIADVDGQKNRVVVMVGHFVHRHDGPRLSLLLDHRGTHLNKPQLHESADSDFDR